MLPLRLVLDTNILVSAAFKSDGIQRAVLTLAITKPARLYVSQPVLDEYAEVLRRPELGIARGIRLQLMQLVRNRSHMVAPVRSIHAALDPDDNIFLECADAGRADYLITGNKRHFPAFWKQTKVISAREFLTLAAPHLLG
jgi:putative PIN family toxin of toxin-antitoxin system